jgi:hypothetical protein
VLDALLETKHEIVSRYIVRSVDRHNVEVPGGGAGYPLRALACYG